MTYYFGAVKNAIGIATRQQENTEVDDLVAGNIIFENGVIFSGTWCFSVAPQDQADSCIVYGSKGHINFPMFGNKITVTTGQSTEEYVFELLQHVQQPMIEKVVDYFLDNGQNPCSGEEALITMKLIDDFTRK